MSALGAPSAAATNRSARLSVSRFDGRASEWDVFIRAQSGWTHFHLHGWRTVIEREFGHECVYLVARDAAGAIVAALPLVRVKSVVFGHYLVSMPFVNYGGPLGSEDGIQAVVAEATRLAATDHVKLLELRSRTELPLDLPVSHRKLTVVLDLKRDAEAMMKALPAKLRSQVKRPMKEGIEVRFGLTQVGPFFDVFAQHMRDLGTPALPRSFFETIAEVFPNDVVFAVAYHEKKPVACGCGFLWNGEFEITWASALREYNKMSPNMLVYWALMERMIERGASLFNFGRCSRDSGTHKFKMQWGSREETLWWYQKVAGAPSEESGTPSPDKGAFAMAARVWQKLPLPVATALGPAIVRFIP
jgi:FemAB-related protein (PEP-CTERM system-associated)